ncbi:hypothetical protein [Synechococcus sp. EJ6-Ellesmere]|uniref:hypothetical protein n=1 Tax=Synechococcus sp. EJ6-Ellesmere TaxID=2823734 RepID=UPI0020CE6375|nr:hypothetical protein [Synechococcus sp. EJ6-Ellesmere]MCP9824503.1 hypothetical protein [Synechococcus sp. EJ6-Ellesmere]
MTVTDSILRAIAAELAPVAERAGATHPRNVARRAVEAKRFELHSLIHEIWTDTETRAERSRARAAAEAAETAVSG